MLKELEEYIEKLKAGSIYPYSVKLNYNDLDKLGEDISEKNTTHSLIERDLGVVIEESQEVPRGSIYVGLRL